MFTHEHFVSPFFMILLRTGTAKKNLKAFYKLKKEEGYEKAIGLYLGLIDDIIFCLRLLEA